MIPKKVFVVPYRDRETHKAIFLSHMKTLLMNDNDYEILIVHQCDSRTFNRGALKNIGFIYVKKMWPNNWKDITLIFHDIDHIPYKRLFGYETRRGIIKHYYGFKFALGGIFAIKAYDFEKVKGFPNYWGWGFEDNKIQDDIKKLGGKIDYSEFLFYTDKKIVKFDSTTKDHGILRIVGKGNLKRATDETYRDSGYHTISNLIYEEKEEGDNVKIINVKSFLTEHKEKAATIIHNVTSKMITLDHKKRQLKADKRNGFRSKLKKINQRQHNFRLF